MPLPRQFLFPPRPLGQIWPILPAWPVPIVGHPKPPTGVGGAVQLDGFQADVVTLETYSSPFSDAVQVDGFQAVVIVMETI